MSKKIVKKNETDRVKSNGSRIGYSDGLSPLTCSKYSVLNFLGFCIALVFRGLLALLTAGRFVSRNTNP